ncbi:MAG: SusF/SusE family outer membrane protein [Bacteroidota bacterium]
MKKNLFLSFTLLWCFCIMGSAQINSIGLIGPATPGGWDVDTNLTQSTTDTNIWEANMNLLTGPAKFRANDEWITSWGAEGFPSDTGRTDNGPNIPVIGGQYDITFNSTTGFYNFVSTATTYDSVSIIGSATPNGWDADTYMVQDTANPNLWTLEITLTDGEAKFREGADWAVNWGDTTFPSGVGFQNGMNIPVEAGDYVITFNSASGEYNFGKDYPVFESFGIIGDATPIGNFDEDVDMTADTDEPWIWRTTIQLTNGTVKFRAEDDWTDNWGGDDFPTGVGVPGGGNIPVQAGEYNVSFNVITLEYSFETTSPVYDAIGIIGSATPGGWDNDTDMIQNPENPFEWSLNITLVDGDAKFRANDNWDVSWGGDDFPSGTATSDNGPDIPVTAGEYKVTFNTATGDYNFGPPIAIFGSVGVIGSALTNEWASDVDMVQDPVDLDQWTAEVHLTDGVVKFRADDDWTVNWGSGDFPVGTGVQNGDDIPVTEGDWIISLNATTGFYTFTPTSVGVVGSSTPGGWDNDTDMSASGEESSVWSITLELIEGAAKFRRNDDWGINWGATDFPTGTGVQNGDDIPVPAGVYDITLNSATGEYAFLLSSNITNVFDFNSINVFPNPTVGLLNIQIENDQIEGDVQIRINDMTGKALYHDQMNARDLKQLDVNQLAAGNYVIQLYAEHFLITKKFIVHK